MNSAITVFILAAALAALAYAVFFREAPRHACHRCGHDELYHDEACHVRGCRCTGYATPPVCEL